jgi:hypothetical protein
MPAIDDDTLLPFSLPNICKKKVTAAFDGDRSVPTARFSFLPPPTSVLA